VVTTRSHILVRYYTIIHKETLQKIGLCVFKSFKSRFFCWQIVRRGCTERKHFVCALTHKKAGHQLSLFKNDDILYRHIERETHTGSLSSYKLDKNEIRKPACSMSRNSRGKKRSGGLAFSFYNFYPLHCLHDDL